MDYSGRRFRIPQENDFQFRSAWIPATPDKPIPATSHPINVVDMSAGNQLGRRAASWEELVGYPTAGYVQQIQNSNQQPTQLDLNGRFDVGLPPLPQRNNRVINHIAAAGTFMQHISNDNSAGWNPATLAELFAFKNAASAAAAAENATQNGTNHVSERHLIQNLQAQQANGNWRRCNTTEMSHSYSQGPSLWSNGKSFTDMLHDGFPAPYRGNYNLNSPPRTVTDATSSITNSFHFAPVTPDQTKKSENNQLSELLNLSVDEGSSHTRGRKQDNLVRSIQNEAIEHHNDELLQNIVYSSSVANVTPIKDGDQEIDLNKTPQQKLPKRRKHRPKVVREGKPKRTPKPVTPQNPNSNQNPTTGKRKYVRKNGHKASTSKPADVLVETVDHPVGSGTAANSCKRVLNFDLEKTTDESQGNLVNQLLETHHGNERAFNANLESEAAEVCSKSNSMSGRKSAAQMDRQNGLLAREQQPGTTSNITHSVDQMRANYEALHKRHVLPTPAESCEDLQIDNLNAVVCSVHTQNIDLKHSSWRNCCSPVNQQHTHAEGIGQIFSHAKNSHESLDRTGQLMLQTSPQSVLQNLADLNEGMKFKRKYPMIEQTHPHNEILNSLLCQEIFQVDQYNNNASNLGKGFSETQKKRKTENIPNKNLSTRVEDGLRQDSKNRANGVNPSLFTSQINHGVLHSHFKTQTNMSNGVNKYTGDWYTPHVTARHDFPKQYNSPKLLSHAPSVVKKQSNRSIQVNTSLAMIEKCNSSPLPPPKKDTTFVDMKGVGINSASTSTKKKVTGPTLSNLSSSRKDKVLLQKQKDLNHNPPSPYTTKGPSEKQKYQISIDEIICQLEVLTLNDKSKEIVGQEQNALVPYKGDGTIVQYEGLYQIKRRKPRPKVDLDPETERLWKLLMGKERSEATEGTDKDKEKWWEEERKVFRGRADSFIARMHLVQGDRRFSRWKGSVVDSVIGVFLTQNVSDHLSSSAFMSLAARFPIKSSSDKNTCYKNETRILVEEPDSITQYEKVPSQPVYNQRPIISQKPLEQRRENLASITERTTFIEACNRQAEEVISMPDSICSFIHQVNGGITPFSLSNSEVKEASSNYIPNKTHGSVSRNLKQPGKTSMFQKLHSGGSWSSLLNDNSNHGHQRPNDTELSKQNHMLNTVDNLHHSFTSMYSVYSSNPPMRVPIISTSNYSLHDTPQSSWPNYASEIAKANNVNCSIQAGQDTECIYNPTFQENGLLRQQVMPRVSPSALFRNHPVQQSSRHQGKEPNQHSFNSPQHERKKIFQSESTSVIGSMKIAEALSDRQKKFVQQDLNVPNLAQKSFEERIPIANSQIEFANKVAERNGKEQNHSSGKELKETSTSTLKTRKGKAEGDKNSTFDWDGLRKQVQSHSKTERIKDVMDSLDYEAVRCADVKQISECIKERGMNNMLAERIKDFLNRLVREHGSIDLEWLRDAPPDKAKEYLLSIWGLGLKSVECVRLLTLHHLAFPVDTNVGRIAVRLGWVPLQPLPESLQLHLLEMYPVLESIQKYLWPRLCKLDQRTLYELHYQMITFGKVFCTKSKPNCNACPMRGECRHFASAFASARLALPGPDEKSIVHSNVPIQEYTNPAVIFNQMQLPSPGDGGSSSKQCEPIIEMPATPEPECLELSESDIEDVFFEDPDEIPEIKLEEFTHNFQNIMQENLEVHDDDMSKALVALNSAAASIPTQKLKNVNRLRTEHQVYELPDTHPLLKGFERREPDDPSPYLLAIWTPGETANSTKPPESQCQFQDSGKVCNEVTCFSCNSIREANLHTVRGTVLIPCRTAMRGSFPLNGTYFQVNEMFADHDSSLNPIDVPRALIWNLPRRTVYFGTSVSTIFRGLSTEGIQYCFWRGFVCVRGFDQNSRAPRPLMARLHFPASKLVKAKNEKKLHADRGAEKITSS